MSIPQGFEIPGQAAEEALRRYSLAFAVARDRHVDARAVATCADDTERSALASRVRQLANELHELYDHSPCGFHSIDSAGLIVQINDTELGWLGYTRDEVVGRMPFTDILPLQYHDWFRSSFARLKERSRLSDLEYEMRRKDGTTFPVSVTAIAIYDADGRFTHSRASVFDISARRKIENELRESELRSTANLRAALDCIVSIDRRGVIIEFNPAAEKTFGYTREQAVGNDVSAMIIPPAMRDAHRRGLARYLATGNASMLGRRVEVTAMRSDGAEFPAELTITPVPLRDETTFTGYLRDITQEKWAEQELRRYADELSALSRRLVTVQEGARRALANELHDLIGQKLTALNINLNIVKSVSTPNAQAASRLQDSLTLVEETIDSIRGVMTELRPPVLDDYGLGPALHWYAKHFADHTGVATTVSEHRPGRRLPLTTEDLLFRIAQEALANIAKYAQAGRVTISLDTASQGARLTIADDGRGFDPSARPPLSSDHGWGLMIMRERAAAAGAELTIESAVGHGTRIIVTLRGDAS